MAAVPQLKPGAAAAIAEHADGTGTLQVVDVQPVGSTITRFRLVLSDGVYTLLQSMLAAPPPRTRDGSLRKGSIIRLREFHCSTIQNRI